MTEKKRIDIVLAERKLVRSRSAARELISLGRVFLGGVVVEKPNTLVSFDADIRVAEPLPFVGRGGQKLEHALTSFSINPKGMTCVDIGSSTGGFTDCLLQHGATKVYAVDVGTNQLAEELRADPRVVVMENTDIRTAVVPELCDLAVIDVSFISLGHIFPVLKRWVKNDGLVIALIKPQFEVGKALLGKQGVVKDERVQEEAVKTVIMNAAEHGLLHRGTVESPILGGTGNREFLGLFNFF